MFLLNAKKGRRHGKYLNFSKGNVDVFVAKYVELEVLEASSVLFCSCFIVCSPDLEHFLG